MINESNFGQNEIIEGKKTNGLIDVNKRSVYDSSEIIHKGLRPVKEQ